jgi:uncharacterized protein YndB with AHSA1/START domain
VHDGRVIERSDTRIRVRQTVDVPAPALFAVLADPRRHVQVDGSGMLQADVDTQPITGVGQVFTMAMRHPSLGDYRTDNHVLEFEAGRRIVWTYDWSEVTDPAVLARVSFPRVSAEALTESVARLATAAG